MRVATRPKPDGNRQVFRRLLVALVLCLLAFTASASAMDHPLPGLEGTAPVSVDLVPDHHQPRFPDCHHDSHHGGVLALLSNQGSGQERSSGDVPDDSASTFPGAVPTRGRYVALRTAPEFRRCASSPVYLLTQRLRL